MPLLSETTLRATLRPCSACGVCVCCRASYSQKQTKQYDAEAMRYLSYALYPLVLGYAVYALMYQTHKSWYSWVLNSLVGAVYAFGFILMCPQLYLNYKLKSVAHLPWCVCVWGGCGVGVEWGWGAEEGSG